LARNALASEKIKAKSALESAKRQLRQLCGDEIANQQLLSHQFEPPKAPQAQSCYLDLIVNNPELSKLKATQLASYYNYELQKVNRIPDLGLSAGIEHFNRQGGLRFYVELGIELPIFDRNQGNICRSGWEAYATLFDLEDLQVEFMARGSDLYAEWQSCFETIELLNQELIPAANELLAIHNDRQMTGKEDCLEWLEANGELCSYQMQYIEAVEKYYHLKANLRYLCGEAFESLDRH
jgi:cobalt-zinc-cadmium efflux system outer membrane protein